MRSIKSLPQSLRPREKLLELGATALTFEELLAAILVTGNRCLSLGQFAKKIAPLIKQGTIDQKRLLDMGLGKTKTVQLLAVWELSHRIKNPSLIRITSVKQAVSLSQDIAYEEKEILLCFYLNGRGELLKKETIAIGSLNKALLLPRELFSPIKNLPVASIILVHNHPSGNSDASEEDISFTKRVKLAGEILGVSVLDHLIVTKNGWSRVKI